MDNTECRGLRIAWFGPLGSGGGVPGMGRQLLAAAMRDPGLEIDFYSEGNPSSVLQFDGQRHRHVAVSSTWSYGRWYSRSQITSFISSSWSRSRAYNRLVDKLLANHRQRPYDLVFQLSQTELFKMGRHTKELPPIVVYPCVHAAGELRFHRKESRFALQSERLLVHYLVRAFLRLRTWRQRKEFEKPALIIGMSWRFNELLRQDCGVSADRQAVIYNQIEPTRLPRGPEPSQSGRRIKLLFISRISVRKGVEMIVELSRRLDDLADSVEIEIIGGSTLWSDYRKCLGRLNARVAKYSGTRTHEQTLATYANADILLLPSHYEPGGIVVGEALAHGMVAVVSDEVGTAEPVSQEVCSRFKAGDMAAFETAVREVIARIREEPAPLRVRAVAEAEEHFNPAAVGRHFVSVLRAVAEHRPASDVSTTPRVTMSKITEAAVAD